jgi:hypothetical protein
VPALLFDSSSLPFDLPASFAFGDEDEAAICADDLGTAWTTTDGALAWLRKHAR